MSPKVVICPVIKEKNLLELFRGGLLSLVRWFIAYPLVYFSYSVKGLQRSPWRMNALQGPGIIVCNHPNVMFDFLMAQVSAPQWCFFVFSSWMARIPGASSFFKAFRAHPFFRRNSQAKNKDEVLESLSHLLVQENWLILFPEGEAESGSGLRPIRYGVARVALEAEKKAGWALPLRIYVLGLNYEKPEVIGSMCFARWAEPIDVKAYYEAYKQDPAGTEVALLKDIENAFHTVVFEGQTSEELENAFRLANFRSQSHFSGVEKALDDLQNGRAKPIEFKKVRCSRTETILYQVLGLTFFKIFSLFARPFRIFARLCAKDKSEEAFYLVLLWFACLGVGACVSQWDWTIGFLVGSILVTRSWLWAWRKGIVK